MIHRPALLILPLLLLAACGKREAAPSVLPARSQLTWQDFLRMQTDALEIARAPLGHTRLLSTYDRKGGNDDFVRWRETEADGWITLADLKGPGVVTRIWKTAHTAEWGFWFDGEGEPRMRLSDKAFFLETFPPTLAGYASGGSTCYLPIPYAESLRIRIRPSALGEAKNYYHIQALDLNPGLSTESFAFPLGPEDRAALDAAHQALSQTDWFLPQPDDTERTVEIPAGGEAEIANLVGPDVLLSLSLRPHLESRNAVWERSALLRQLWISGTWDDAPAPSLRMPLGDYAANAFFPRRHASQFTAFHDGFFHGRFPMPFHRSARLTLSNQSDRPVTVDLRLRLRGRAPDADMRYAHASFSELRSPRRRAGQPLNLLNTKGRGHLAGTYLNAIGTDGSWFILESDERIRRDSEITPGWHGTGLEDYFNGAWYYSGLFERPFHGLLEKAPVRTGQYRWHLLDRVDYRESLDFSFEFGHANQNAGYMSALTWWYQETAAEAPALPRALAVEHPPVPDPLATYSLMAHLFELEREGLWEEARERCRYYVETEKPSPSQELADLRAVAYGEKIGGFESIRTALEAIASDPRHTGQQQARMLLRARTEPHAALIGVHVNGRYMLYLNANAQIKGEDPTQLVTLLAGILPGEHELGIECTPSRDDPWVSAFLSHAQTNFVSDTSWEYTDVRPPKWPQTGEPGEDWKPNPSLTNIDMLPRQGIWQYAPNGFIGVQAERQLLRPWRHGPVSERGRTLYFRRRFVIPEPQP